MQPVSNSTRRGSAHLLIRNTPLWYRDAIVLLIILAAPPMDLEQLPAYQRNHCEPNRLNIGWYPPPCRQHFLREVLVDRIGQHLTPAVVSARLAARRGFSWITPVQAGGARTA